MGLSIVKMGCLSRQAIAIWLSVILTLLSFAAASHTHTQDEGVKVECTLCFHQFQLNKTLPSIAFELNVEAQHYCNSPAVQPETNSVHVRHYRSRAPPLSL